MNEVGARVHSVLVVDDNPLIVNVLKSLLCAEGYNVHTSENGNEALDVLGRRDVDIIICDVMMPGMDGYELHEKVRQKADLAHIPFLFLTALGDSEEVTKGRETGADDYIVKPFDPRELVSLLKGKLRRSERLREFVDEKYDAYRRKVIHTLSHEFRTPLVAINTGTELLLDQGDAFQRERVMGLIEAIRRGGQRLEKLVNDFMLIQQIEAGMAARVFEQRKKLCRISTLVEEYCEARIESIQKEGFSLEYCDATDGCRVWIHEPQIYDVLDRLINNAMKFKTENWHLEINSYTLEDAVCVEVRDRGIGFDTARIREAIDLFGQLDRDKMEQQGSGLGLAIAARYARVHGGRLEFENREGGGSIVRLVLPKGDRLPD